MSQVINATDRFAAAQKNHEYEEIKKQFVEMFGDQPPEVFLAICEALLKGDKEEYFRITEPIIMRKAIKDFSQLH